MRDKEVTLFGWSDKEELKQEKEYGQRIHIRMEVRKKKQSVWEKEKSHRFLHWCRCCVWSMNFNHITMINNLCFFLHLVLTLDEKKTTFNQCHKSLQIQHKALQAECGFGCPLTKSFKRPYVKASSTYTCIRVIIAVCFLHCIFSAMFLHVALSLWRQ